MNDAITQTLKILPDAPGVYIMHDARGKVIYVGKAVILKNRVRSYFRESSKQSAKVRALVSHVAEIETIVTANEMEALILECNLIKKYKPRYNISLKDDKTYPYLKITLQEDFPRIYVTRRTSRDGAKYYGPFADAGAMHANLKLIRTLFPLRHCRTMNAQRPCLQYHMKRCLAPCAGLVTKDAYRKMLSSVMLLLDGKIATLEKELKSKMLEASEKMEFEVAARYRDALRSLAYLNEEQKAVTESGDQDAIGIAADATGVCVQVFFIRGGKLLGRDTFFLDQETGGALPEIMAEFLKRYYNEGRFIPKEILLSTTLPYEEETLLANWLSEKAQRKISVLIPQKGMKHDLIKMVVENAVKILQERLRKGKLAKESNMAAAEDLQKALGMQEPLERIDCFDISHTQGAETVASMVVCRNGSMSKKDYRRYKILSAEGKPDDFKSMQEVVYRRYHDAEDLPTLVIIDGGKGQLSSALGVIRGLGLAELKVVGLAKREEEIFEEGRSTSILLEKTSEALHLIQRIRDEAHRFAITYHRKLRGKRNLVSVLDHLEGIGPKRRQALWNNFASLDAMKKASVEELAKIAGMNRTAAETVYAFFRKDVAAKQLEIKK